MSFLVYKSSAGSGKTYTLVQQFLKLALANDQPEKIRNMLAITFTNKAAGEMKERIIGALSEIANDQGDSLKCQELAVLLGIDGLEVKARAQASLSYLLHHYSDFSILTIDKFFQRVARAFAFDLDLPMQFKLEVSNDELLEQSIDRVMDRVGKDPQLSRLVIDQAIRKVEDDGNWRLDRQLANYAKQLFTEQGKSKIAKWMEPTLDDFGQLLKDKHALLAAMKKQVMEPARHLLEMIDEHHIVPNELLGKSNNVTRYLKQAASFGSKAMEPSNTVRKNLTAENWAHKQAGPETLAGLSQVQSSLIEASIELLETIDHLVGPMEELKTILSGLYEMILMRELQNEMDALVTEENRVHLSTFVERIANVVLNEPVPYIYERMGERYHHIFIDEFQDTSLLQWLNLVPMIDNALSYNQSNMVVGDAKQAIYRWRGGDVEQFTNLPALKMDDKIGALGHYEDSLKRNYKEEMLSHNYRSTPAVVKVVNDLFQAMAAEEGLIAQVYAGHAQTPKRSDLLGYVAIKSWTEPDTEQRIPMAIEQIREVVSRGYHYGDIAILCRSNRIATQFAEGLKQARIPVTSGDSLKLDQHSGIQFLALALHYISDPNQQEVWGKILINLHGHGVLDQQDLSTYRSFENAAGFSDFLKSKGLATTLFEPGNKPLYELVAILIRSMPFLNEIDPYLLLFQDIILQFQSSEWGNIDQFLPWWNGKKSDLCMPEDVAVQAVKVLTIHKSKGLEYPVVLLPTLLMGNRSARNVKWLNVDGHEGIPSALIALNQKLENTQFGPEVAAEVEKTLLDEMNLLYVALTRARDECYCWTSKEERSTAGHKLMWEALESLPDWTAGGLERGEQTTINQDLTHLLGEPLTVISSERQFIALRRSVEKPLWNPDKSALLGQSIHWVLDRLEVKDGLERLLERCTYKFRLDSALAAKVESTVLQLIDKGWLDLLGQKGGRVVSEWSISKHGKILRPDKVIVSQDQAIVVDFKTGAKLDKHQRQVAAYVDALYASGYGKVQGYLLYTSEVELTKVN